MQWGFSVTGQDLVLSDELSSLESVPELSEAIEILRDNNPGILAAQAQVKDAKIRKKLTMASRLPSLDATLSYNAIDDEFGGLSDALQKRLGYEYRIKFIISNI